MDPKNLGNILSKFDTLNVLCIGDVMLDRFIYGNASRISPEAPIPVLSISHQSSMLGGAGNVARNVLSLGANVTLISVVGDDAEGREIFHLLDQEEKLCADLVVSANRPTTVKTRYIAESQQLLRADAEVSHAISANTAEKVIANFANAIKTTDVVILSDYAKGLLNDDVLKEVISLAKQHGKPVIADPKSSDFSRYNGVSILTPNRKEMEAATGSSCKLDDDVTKAGQTVLNELDFSAILITRSESGMSMIEKNAAHHIPAQALEVYDVSGAGDTVISCLSLSIAAGGTYKEATFLANLAGGLVVAKTGTAVVTLDELNNALHSVEIHSADAKISSLQQALKRVDQWRAKGLTVGFTNGCFDLIHPGHISLIRQAKAQCDRLIVGLNTDDSIKRLKGPDRPATGETSRAIVLASLEDVSLVVPFDEDTPINLIEALKPDVLIKGADYTVETVVGSDLVMAYGGRIFLAELKEGFSTTGTIQRLLEIDRNKDS